MKLAKTTWSYFLKIKIWFFSQMLIHAKRCHCICLDVWPIPYLCSGKSLRTVVLAIWLENISMFYFIVDIHECYKALFRLIYRFWILGNLKKKIAIAACTRLYFRKYMVCMYIYKHLKWYLLLNIILLFYRNIKTYVFSESHSLFWKSNACIEKLVSQELHYS